MENLTALFLISLLIGLIILIPMMLFIPKYFGTQPVVIGSFSGIVGVGLGMKIADRLRWF